MTPNEERWAEALAVERKYGGRAPVWIATRIGELAMAGDMAGVERFKQIAARLEKLIRAKEQ